MNPFSFIVSNFSRIVQFTVESILEHDITTQGQSSLIIIFDTFSALHIGGII